MRRIALAAALTGVAALQVAEAESIDSASLTRAGEKEVAVA